MAMNTESVFSSDGDQEHETSAETRAAGSGSSPDPLAGDSAATDVAVEETARTLTAAAEVGDDDLQDQPSFPIVGIGASAGGVAAIEQFFASMPVNSETGIAFVVVQHLDPTHPSMLTQLVRQYTRMTVYEVEDGMEVQPNCAYIIPPNRDMALLRGRLNLLEPGAARGLRLPIDFFFRSLAHDQQERAIAIILSGAGTDGTLGVKAIKESGGMVMVQEPETAQHSGMPSSAIATGLADFILPPADMPAQLLGYIQHAFGKEVDESAAAAAEAVDPLQKIFVLLRMQTGHDFSRYKHNTILRRIARRMAVHQIEEMDEYVHFLQQNYGEVSTLFKELLIGVTNFFRDPEAFGALQERVIPRLFAEKRTGEPVRVWVPGCATGEEAYSIAILLQDYMTRIKESYSIQIFATDIDLDAIDRARMGIYPANIAADVSADHLARFFTEQDNSYHVKKLIRDMVVFAEQDVITDPPFSRLDLVSCRNLLIYLNTDLQRKVLPLFHYALNPEGYLFLGTSETIGEFGDYFRPIDRRWKIYLRKPGLRQHRTAADFSYRLPIAPLPHRRGPQPSQPEDRVSLRTVVEQTMLNTYAPPAIAVNEDGHVLYIQGHTGRYLEPAPGEASLNISRMLREGLRLEVMTGLRQAIAQKQPVTCQRLRSRVNGSTYVVNVHIKPLVEPAALSGTLLIVFEEEGEQHDPESREPASSLDPDSGDRIARLERELRAKEEYLQTNIEEVETSNEELQSANEELQSTNEELETSKEELQSVNEELMTVNTELQKKIEDLSLVNNDLSNLLTSTGIGTVFVDYQLRIQRFTSAATEIINLIPSDIGRPVSHIVSNLMDHRNLEDDVADVLERLVLKEAEVQVKNGRWYLMRIQPYRTMENVIEGAVMVFIEITPQRRIQEALHDLQRLRLDGLGDAVLFLDSNGKIIDCNQEAVERFGYSRDALSAMGIADLAATDRQRAMREALRQAQVEETVTVESIVQSKEGNAIPVEVRLRKSELDETTPIIAGLRNLTQRRLAEQATRRELAALRKQTVMVSESVDAVVVRDLAGQVLAWNPAAERLYGWSEAEALQLRAEDLIPPEKLEKERQIAQKLAAGDDVEPFVTERQTKDGRSILARASVTALCDAASNVYAVAAVERALNAASSGS